MAYAASTGPATAIATTNAIATSTNAIATTAAASIATTASATATAATPSSSRRWCWCEVAAIVHLAVDGTHHQTVTLRLSHLFQHLN